MDYHGDNKLVDSSTIIPNNNDKNVVSNSLPSESSVLRDNKESQIINKDIRKKNIRKKRYEPSEDEEYEIKRPKCKSFQ